jgi:hypothetical protein
MVQDNSDLTGRAIENHNEAAKSHGIAKEFARAVGTRKQ